MKSRSVLFNIVVTFTFICFVVVILSVARALEYKAGDKYISTSSESWPTYARNGSMLYQTDTRKEFIWVSGQGWTTLVYDGNTISPWDTASIRSQAQSVVDGNPWGWATPGSPDVVNPMYFQILCASTASAPGSSYFCGNAVGLAALTNPSSGRSIIMPRNGTIKKASVVIVFNTPAPNGAGIGAYLWYSNGGPASYLISTISNTTSQTLTFTNNQMNIPYNAGDSIAFKFVPPPSWTTAPGAGFPGGGFYSECLKCHSATPAGTHHQEVY